MQNILLCHCFLGHCLHTKHTSPSLKLPSFVGMASALKGSVVGKVVETVKVRLLSVSVDFWPGEKEKRRREREEGEGVNILVSLYSVQFAII